MITVLLAASTSRARAALATLLDRQKTHHALVASAELGLSEQIEAVRPDVLVLDTGGDSPAAALDTLALMARPPAVVLVTDHARDAVDGTRLRAGIAAVLPHHLTADELAAAIDAAAAGLLVLHRDIEREIAWSRAGTSAPIAVAADRALTSREIEVLGMLAEGLANKAIAARLGITDHTVKFHVAEILDKLDAETRTEAVTIGIRRGLILV